jgi:hypothetical protein
MPGYLLLRNNKESGPFSLQQLISMTLKPYDLVWVEGKSAAWRYPGEIEELKAYAPPVEEQPYDRFYKKNTIQQQQHELVTIEENVKNVTAQAPAAVVDKKVATNTVPVQQPVPVISGKRVFVTMPVTGQVVPPNKIPDSHTITEISIDTPAVNPLPIQQDRVVKKAAPQETATWVLEEKYSMPLDDIKQLYVENLLSKQTQKKKSFKPAGSAVMLLAVTVFFVLAIVAGTFLSGKKDRENHSAAILPNANNEIVQQTSIADITGGEPNSPAPSKLPNKQTPVVSNKTSAIPVSVKAGGYVEAAKAVTINENGNTENNTADDVSEEAVLQEAMAVTDEAAMHTNTADNALVKQNEPLMAVTTTHHSNGQAKPVNVLTAAVPDPEKAGTKKKIRKLLVIDKVDYKTGLLGGIRNASVSLTNHSNYKMDLVMVDVDYLKANDNTIKTERLYFKNIPPSGTITLEAPAGQGSKLDCRITLISSKELDYIYATVN